MRQNGSETTTCRSNLATVTGTQVGGYGSQTQSGSMLPELPEERIDQGLEWLKLSLPSLRESTESIKQAEAAVKALTVPSDPARRAARILALLSPYFEKETPMAVREIEAEDWSIALRGFPQWAIDRACRWWKSDANSDRRKRPLEGDIVARCKLEMAIVKAAKIKINAGVGEDYRPEKSTIKNRVTAEQAAKILAKAGFSPKKMEG